MLSTNTVLSRSKLRPYVQPSSSWQQKRKTCQSVKLLQGTTFQQKWSPSDTWSFNKTC